MSKNQKRHLFWFKKWLKKADSSVLFVFIVGILGVILFILESEIKDVEANVVVPLEPVFSYPMVEGNSLLPISNHLLPKKNFVVFSKIPAMVTAYSSTPCQTDNDPYITASGSQVREGVVANNILPFGTKIRFPELFGDKIFVVEDRMHWRKNNYQFDIWMDSYEKAKDFGVKQAIVEILEI